MKKKFRALQGAYNAGKARDIIYFKNGDALLFGLACMEILYAYTVSFLFIFIYFEAQLILKI